jgi:hypothetical protein
MKWGVAREAETVQGILALASLPLGSKLLYQCHFLNCLQAAAVAGKSALATKGFEDVALASLTVH